MVNNISSSLIKADRLCDRIPVLSSINNLVDLVQKALIVSSKTSGSGQASRYFSYLNQKSAARCAILMIPFIGNLIIGLFDFAKEQKVKTLDKVEGNSLPEQIHVKLDEDYIKIRKDPLALKDAPPRLQNDRFTVCDAVRKNGLALEFASNELKNDISVVEAAVQQNGLALKFASEELRSRSDIAEIAVKKDGMALQHVKKDELGDKIFLVPLWAVQQNGLALKHAPEWKDNDQLVQAAVKQNPSALQFASQRIKDETKKTTQ